MESKKLTVVITTYNRKTPLYEQLHSLETQGLYDKYQIIVSNNCSDYDVDAWLDEKLTLEFRKIVTVYNRPYNIGGDMNIAFSFQLVKTPWMWLLSDDDICEPNALQIIFEDIEKHSDVCWMKYSISGESFAPLPDKEVSSLTEVFNVFSTKPHTAGEFVFMSNNVYNIEIIKPYIGKAPEVLQTCFSQLIPQFYAIKRDGAKAYLSPRALTNYVTGRCIIKNLNYVYSRFFNLTFADLILTKKEFLSFQKLLFVTIRKLIKMLFAIKERHIRRAYFRRYRADYFPYLSLRGFLFSCIFFILNAFNVNVETLISIDKVVKNVLRMLKGSTATKDDI